MKLNAWFLFAGSLTSAAVHSDGDKIYAQVSDVDLGHGTTVHEGVNYAFHAPPSTEHWYICNSNGTETPHWKYLPNMKTAAAAPLGDAIAAGAVDAGSHFTDTADVALDRRQRPPNYINYYNLARCDDFDSQNQPITQNQCVYNRGLVAWSSSFTPVGSTCRFIVNYYNSGCGPQASCGGYITQTFDFTGCFNPARVFCSTFARCCLSGC